MTTHQLAQLWTEWIGRAESLQSALAEQKEALIAREMDRVENLIPVVEDRRTALLDADERAREACINLAAELGVGASLPAIAKKLQPLESARLRNLAAKVTKHGEAIRNALIQNHALVENELSYTAVTLSLIGQALREPATPYMGSTEPGALSLDRKV